MSNQIDGIWVCVPLNRATAENAKYSLDVEWRDFKSFADPTEMWGTITIDGREYWISFTSGEELWYLAIVDKSISPQEIYWNRAGAVWEWRGIHRIDTWMILFVDTARVIVDSCLAMAEWPKGGGHPDNQSK